MRILFLGNNWLGWQVLQWLAEQGEEVVGLVVHPDKRRKFGSEILGAIELDASRIFDGSRLREASVRKAVAALDADIAISVMFGYILRPEFIELFPQGVINLHPAYLPYGRGAYPNVWSIIEGTPAGATLHYIDPGIDTGDIIAQKRVEVEVVDTGATLYRKLEQASLALFQETWPQICSGDVPRFPQSSEAGTYHRSRDVRTVDEIHLDQAYPARELLDLIRARTFPPHPGAYFVHEGRKIYLRLTLIDEQELADDQ